MAQPIANGKLRENQWPHGQWVGEPAGGASEGDVALGTHGQQHRWHHLKGHHHHRKKQADREARGHRVAAWDPQRAVGDRARHDLPPPPMAEARVAQRFERQFHQSEVAFFHADVTERGERRLSRTSTQSK